MGYCELPAAYSLPWEHFKSMTDIDQISISVQALYITSLCTIKFSILLFYNRIFGVARPMFRYILLVKGGVVIAYSVAGILVTVLQCIPLSDLWKPSSKNPLRCIHFGTAVLTVGVINIVTDITILSLPIRLVWSLQMSRLHKGQVVAVFLLGGL